MSAFVVSDKTICSVVDMISKYEDLKKKSWTAQRLYLLNMESVNQRYRLRDSKRERDREEYSRYVEHFENFEYFPQPDRDSVAIHLAGKCWLYQSIAGDCVDRLPFFNAFRALLRRHALDTAKEINGRDVFDIQEADWMIEDYLHREENIRKYENIWG